METDAEPTSNVRFKEPLSSSSFAKTLGDRIDSYFEIRGTSKNANAEMIIKSVIGFAFFIASYCLILTDWFQGMALVGMFVAHGIAQLFIAFNVAHDANHGAYSGKTRVNHVLSWTFDLVGINSYMWRLMHNDSHHSFVNVHGADTAISSNRLFRFTPNEKWYPIHRFQHLYISLIYCLSTLEWVLFKDYYWFSTQKKFGNRIIEKHPLKELVFLLATKAFYYTYVLVIPILVLSSPWYYVVMGFVAFHFLIGFTIALIFQPAHINEGTVYPKPDEEGNVTNNYMKHVIDTTADYAWRNPVANWILGCLNVHTVHHIFPGICHVHYPALTEIIHETVDEYGIPCRENKTIAGAYFAHLRTLKQLGKPPGAAAATSASS